MTLSHRNVETHSYKTLFEEDNFEIRNYDPVMKAKIILIPETIIL